MDIQFLVNYNFITIKLFMKIIKSTDLQEMLPFTFAVFSLDKCNPWKKERKKKDMIVGQVEFSHYYTVYKH